MVDVKILKGVRDNLYNVLVAASRDRKLRPDLLETGEFAWVVYERLVMTELVNAWRAHRGLGPADPVELRRVERSAEGYSDYVAKFALGCAELALKED